MLRRARFWCRLSKIIAWKLINIDPYHQRQNVVNNSSFRQYKQYKSFTDIRRRILQESRQTGAGSLKWTILQFSRFYIFVSYRNNVGINCTLRRHTILDFCWHQKGWPWMTLNARFNLKCALRTARLTYVCCGFRSWPCVTELTWALTVSDINVANQLWFHHFRAMRFVRIFAGV